MTIVKTDKDNQEVILTRIIDRKVYNIKFNYNVKVKDVAEYFTIKDDVFKSLCRDYKYVNDDEKA